MFKSYWWVNLHRYLYGEQTVDLWANGEPDATGGDEGSKPPQFCGLFQNSGNDPFTIHRSYCTCPAPAPPGAATSKQSETIADGFVCKWKKCATDSAKPVCAPAAHLSRICISALFFMCTLSVLSSCTAY